MEALARLNADLENFGPRLPHLMTKIIERTEEMEIQVVNIKAGDVSYRIAPGPLVAQCLTGEIELESPEITNKLSACQLKHLKANKLYSIRAISDSTVLIIIAFQASNPENTIPIK